MIIYPVENYDELINNSKTFYPITSRGFWHNGVHFTSDGVPVRNIYTGTVVAMRLIEDYEKIDVKKIPERYAYIFAGYEDYFTKDDEFYTIKKDLSKEDLEGGLTEEGKLHASIMIGSTFSNNFVLIKHTVTTQSEKTIEFYSLAMHLRPAHKLTFAEKLKTCWYDLKFSISEPTYNSVDVVHIIPKTEFNKDDTSNSYTRTEEIFQIPCETIIKIIDDSDQTYSIIEYNLDEITTICAIKKSLYRNFPTHCEVKRLPRTAAEKKNTDNFLEEATKKKGIVIYSKKDKSERAVTHVCKPETFFLIDSTFYTNYDKDSGSFVEFMHNNNLCSGYIYLKITNSDTLTKDIKSTTELRVSIENYTFKSELKKSIAIDGISIPNRELETDDIIGYCGSGNKAYNKVLPLHYEIFCANRDFMTFDKNKKSCRSTFYTISEGSEISCYTEKPTTHTEKILLDGLEIENIHLKVESEKTLLQGEVFYKVTVMANIADMADIKEIYPTVKLKNDIIESFIDSSYYMHTVDENNFFYNKNDLAVPEERFPSGCSYLLEKENALTYKIIYKYTYPSSTDTTFWIKRNDLEKCLKGGVKKFKKLSENNYLIRDSSLAQEILKEPNSIGKRTLVSLRNGVLEDENSYITENADTGNIKWKKMKNNNTSYWINEATLHEKSEKNYNNWHDFFYEATSENATTGYKPKTYKNLLLNTNTSFNDDINFADFVRFHKEDLQQLVHERSTEWQESEEYIDAFCAGLGKKKREFIKTKLEKLSFWDNVRNKRPQPIKKNIVEKVLDVLMFWKPDPEAILITPNFPAKDENWYFHPINFIDHLNKIIPINPYKSVKNIFYPGKENMSRLLNVTSSPGFAAEFKSGEKYTVGNKSYGKINGCFNQNYATEDQYKGYKWFYHEGLDLRGPLGMEIHSFIYAEIIAYGWYGRYGKTIILRNLSGIGVYLLAHLSEYMENIEVGVTVIPGQVVGKTGESGVAINSWVAHLHITYYHYDEDTANIFTAEFVDGIRQIGIGNWDKYKALLKEIRDPFNHTSTEEKLANMTFKEYNNENNKKV